MIVMHRLVPGLIQDLALWVISPIQGFHGYYASWEQASVKTQGYETPSITESYQREFRRVSSGNGAQQSKLSQRKIRVLAGFGVIERDLSRPISSVLDFGGAYGSDYFELRSKIPTLATWEVIYSPAVVEAFRTLGVLPSGGGGTLFLLIHRR